MKKFICLVLLLCGQLAPASATPATVPVPDPAEVYDCTVKAKLYLITEAGVFGVGFSVTADTCSEAYQGLSQAIAGFLNAF